MHTFIQGVNVQNSDEIMHVNSPRHFSKVTAYVKLTITEFIQTCGVWRKCHTYLHNYFSNLLRCDVSDMMWWKDRHFSIFSVPTIGCHPPLHSSYISPLSSKVIPFTEYLLYCQRKCFNKELDKRVYYLGLLASTIYDGVLAYGKL